MVTQAPDTKVVRLGLAAKIPMELRKSKFRRNTWKNGLNGRKIDVSSAYRPKIYHILPFSVEIVQL